MVYSSQNPGSASPQPETIIWQGHPSQMGNLGIYILCGLTVWAVIPLFIAFWYWLRTVNERYIISTERVRMSQGVFNRTTDEVELYRVRDVSLNQPLWQRLFSLANLTLITTDSSTPTVTLRAIANADDLWDQIRRHAEICRRQKGISEVDFT